MTLTDLTLTEAVDKLRSGEIPAGELTQAYLVWIAMIDPKIDAYITVTSERACRQDKQADASCGKSQGMPLSGIPLAIKDVLCTEGVQTTAASRILEGFVPPYTATSVQKLFDAGAVMLGKTNCDEFAMGSSTENSAYCITRNPWNLERIPGGSSGGSAAAVAARTALGALGTDTGGSGRQPASMCGVVGIKPSYGRVSRYGLIAFASSLDQVGVFGRNVRDTATLLNVISGYDERDSTSMNTAVPDYAATLTGSIKGLRVGVPKEYFVKGIQPEVEQAVRAAIEQLRSLGAEVREVRLPHTSY